MTKRPDVGMAAKKKTRIYSKVTPKPPKENRKCLRCLKLFRSAGKFNRICPICTENNKSESGIMECRVVVQKGYGDL